MLASLKLCNEVLVKYYGKPEEVYPLYIVMYVLNGFLSVTAVFGNASLIFALRKPSSIPSPTRTLLRFLAITDLTTGVLGHPLYIAVISKILQHYSCENVREILLAFFLIQTSLTGCSFMVLTFIGVDRFLAIYLHLRYNELVTTKRIITVVLASWTFSLATIFISVFWYFKVGEVVLLIAAYCSTFLLSIIYIKLFLVARQHTASINSQAQVAMHLSSFTSMARIKNLAIKTFYVYLVFLLCYCPYLITLTVLLAISQPNAAIKGAIQLTTVVMLLNSSLNPVVFGWKMKEVRQIVKNDFKNFMFWKAEDTL